MKEIKSRQLLKEWQELIVNDRAIIKAVESTAKTSKIVSSSENAKHIARILKETTEELDGPFYLSPYNPSHTNYCFGDDDCCGIFNALNDDLEVICNECGMKLTDLTEDIYGNPKGITEEQTLIKFQTMCEESLPPDEFGEIFEAFQKTMVLLARNRKALIDFNLCQYCSNVFATCNSNPTFGRGRGKDNVIACDNIKLIK